MLEKEIEQVLVRSVKNIGGLCLKLIAVYPVRKLLL